MNDINIIKGFMSKPDCDFLISYIDKNYNDEKRFKHRVGVAFNKGLAVRALFPEEKPAVLFKDLSDVVTRYSEKLLKILKDDGDIFFYGVSITRLSEDIQLRIHQDIHNDKLDLFKSCIIYLNSDYEGGEICFLDEFVPDSDFPLYQDSMGGLTIKPDKGDAIIIPSLKWHGSRKVESGNRYSIIFWMTKQKEFEFRGFDSELVWNEIYD